LEKEKSAVASISTSTLFITGARLFCGCRHQQQCVVVVVAFAKAAPLFKGRALLLLARRKSATSSHRREQKDSGLILRVALDIGV